ncbi:MAG: DUF1080 domain-containing protein [Flammeovirgaceae bacterium]|nr:DUF1080 domain-containing protein [Flammeovirgaceae bacterium]
MGKKQFTIIIFILAFVFNGFAQDDKGWEQLFNGKDFTGFKQLNGEAEYKVENGEMVGISKLNTPNSFMATEKTYSDFILEVEVKVHPLLNSGIQIRSLSNADYRDGRVHGYQVEIDPSGRAYSGGIYDEARRGWLYNLGRNQKGRTALKQGEWNKYHIECIGNNIRTWINGIQCANLIDDMTAEGFIAFQVHGIGREEQAGTTVRWKNIRIKTKDLASSSWENQPYCEVFNLVPNTISTEEKRAGWRLLWDGKSSAGWRSAKSDKFPEKGWEMKEGILTVLESGGGESENGGDIVTIDKFSSFELQVDFKITEGANSGIKYFVDPELNKGSGSAIGLEFQVLDDKAHPDAKMGVNGNRTVGSLYDLITAENLSIPGSKNKGFGGIGKWNHARVVVKGDHVEHWLNNNLVVTFDRNSQMFRALVAYSKYRKWENFGQIPEGHILLQDHGNTVHFRSVKIREF